MLEAASKGLFCQLITIPLFKEHKVLTQVAGHGSHTIKLIPPLTINDADCDWIVRAFDEVIADSHRPARSGRSARRSRSTRSAHGPSAHFKSQPQRWDDAVRLLRRAAHATILPANTKME